MLSEKGSISVSLLPDLNKLLHSFNMLLINFEIKYANGKKKSIRFALSDCWRHRSLKLLFLFVHVLSMCPNERSDTDNTTNTKNTK